MNKDLYYSMKTSKAVKVKSKDKDEDVEQPW